MLSALQKTVANHEIITVVVVAFIDTKRSRLTYESETLSKTLYWALHLLMPSSIMC